MGDSCDSAWILVTTTVCVADGGYPELEATVFVFPKGFTKNGQERVVVLNAVARSVVEGERGNHPEFVFRYKGRPISRMSNSAWKAARLRARPPQCGFMI